MADDDISAKPPITPGQKIEPVGEDNKLDNNLGSSQPSPFNLKGGNAGASGSNPTQAPSPMDVAAQSAQTSSNNQGSPTVEQTSQQVGQLNDKIQNLKDQINNSAQKVNMSDSAQQVLSYHANRFTDHLNALNKRLGGPEQTPTPVPNAPQSPIETWLSCLTDGQNQLNQVQGLMQKMGASGKAPTTGELMYVQSKVNSASQEIQFFTAFLGQSLDTLKQMMNIQM